MTRFQLSLRASGASVASNIQLRLSRESEEPNLKKGGQSNAQENFCCRALCGNRFEPSVCNTKNETHDLLSIASNNAVSQNNVGVQKLSKAEMEQVEGGKFSLRKLIRPLKPCAILVCRK